MNIRAVTYQDDVARKMHILREKLAELEVSLNEMDDSGQASSLVAKFKQSFNLRSQINKRPLATIGIATGVGLGVGAWLGRPHDPKRESAIESVPSVGSAFVSAVGRHLAEFAAGALVSYLAQELMSHRNQQKEG